MPSAASGSTGSEPEPPKQDEGSCIQIVSSDVDQRDWAPSTGNMPTRAAQSTSCQVSLTAFSSQRGFGLLMVDCETP
jgi:hypothetical protein